MATRASVTLHLADMDGHDAAAYETAFESLRRVGADALVVPSSTKFVRDGRIIIDLAARQRIPAIYEWASMAHDGALMAYGANMAEMDRQAAALVDKILRGARPADLPIEQPTRFDLAINLKTAKAIGLSIPPSLLARADLLIE